MARENRKGYRTRKYRYYLGNVEYYAVEANGGDSSDFPGWFGYIDYRVK